MDRKGYDVGGETRPGTAVDHILSCSGMFDTTKKTRKNVSKNMELREPGLSIDPRVKRSDATSFVHQ